jgi:hypothetical protein
MRGVSKSRLISHFAATASGCTGTKRISGHDSLLAALAFASPAEIVKSPIGMGEGNHAPPSKLHPGQIFEIGTVWLTLGDRHGNAPFSMLCLGSPWRFNAVAIRKLYHESGARHV